MTESGNDFEVNKLLSQYDRQDRLSNYFELLLRENLKINLVSRETSLTDLRKLAAQSLYPLRELDVLSVGSYLDIGSGGGFPAVPLIFVLGPTNISLIERQKKKAAALGRIIVELGLEAEIVCEDFIGWKESRKFDLITLRLVRLDRRLLKKIGQSLAPGGKFVHMSSAKPDFSFSGLNLTARPYPGPDQVESGRPIQCYTVYTRR